MTSHLSSNKVRLERANIVFSDEKFFTVEQSVNSQNDRIYLTDQSDKSLNHRSATRSQHMSHFFSSPFWKVRFELKNTPIPKR